MGVFITDKDGKLKKVAGNFIPKENPNLDCLRTKVLWTNPNPTSQFSNVSINLEENNCDYFEIRYRYNTTYNMSDSVKIPAITGETTLLTIVNTPVILYVRKATVSSRTTIKFDSSYYGTTGSESIDNTTIIPIEVIGYTKTPAMIYTGAELHEGNGISIKDGVISANEKESFLLTHPINSLYITEEEESPIDKYGGGWLKIGEGYTLWTASSGAGETISAGLPNISGSVTFSTNGQNGFISGASGAFSASTSVGYTAGTSGAANSSRYKVFNFNASKSSSIYGSSTTVQPPAYKVYIWKRIS